MATTITNTIKSSGGDYTSLSAWEAGEQRNLVTADEIEVAECYNFSVTDSVNISGWTTDATRYIKIVAPAAERHDGRARAVSGTGFRITTGVSAQSPLSVAQSHVYLEGLELEHTHASASYPAFLANTGAGNVYIRDCIIHDTRTGSAPTMECSLSGLVLKMRSTIVYGSGRSIDARNATSLELLNCVFWRHAAEYGVLANTLVAKNTYSGHASGALDDFWPGTGNNNASSDTTATAYYTSSLASVAGTAFVSTTAGAEDFHLASGSSLIGAGANLYSDFTTDIDGDTWPSSGAWDIGADHYVSAGGSLSLTASLSVAIQQARTLTASLSAAVQAPRTTSAVADAAVQAARTTQVSLDTAVQTAASAVASLQTAVQAAGLQTASINGALQLARSATVALDLAVQAHLSATASVNLQVQAAASATASLNLQIQAGSSASVSLGMAVLQSALSAVGLDLAVLRVGSQTAGISAALQAARSAAAAIDVAIQTVRSASASVNLQVQDGISALASIDVAVRQAQSAVAGVQLAIVQTATASASLDVVAMLQRAVSAALGGAVSAARIASAGLSFYVDDGGVIVITGPIRLLAIISQEIAFEATIEQA